MASLSPNISSAKTLASSVFPTPVGPRNIKEPIGRLGSLRSARERRRALEMTSVAIVCPITSLCSTDSSLSNFLLSASSILDSGMPVHAATTWSISSSSTTRRFSSRVFFHSSIASVCFLRNCFSSSRYLAAPSKCCLAMASSFLAQTSSISAAMVSNSTGCLSDSIRARAPASSRMSIALSGRKREVM